MTKYSLKESFLIKENKGIELKGNKLSVYHLTGSKKFKDYSSYVKDTEKPFKSSKPRKVKDRDRNIINRVTYDKARSGATTQSKSDIEFQGITELLSDPYTVGTGFTPGHGDMYGPGLYTCYDFNPSIVHLYGDILHHYLLSSQEKRQFLDYLLWQPLLIQHKWIIASINPRMNLNLLM